MSSLHRSPRCFRCPRIDRCASPWPRWAAGVRDQQAGHVDDPLQLSHPVKKIQHRVVRPIQFDFERHFGIELASRHRLGSVASNLDSRLHGLGVQHLDEAVHLFLVGDDFPLDFELLFQIRQLPIHVLELGRVRFEFGILAAL